LYWPCRAGALAPTAFLKITLSGVRECPLGVVSPRWEPGQKLPFGARHLIALKLTFRMSEMRTLMA